MPRRMNAPLPRGRYLRARPEFFAKLDREAEHLSAALGVRYTWADVARRAIARFVNGLPEEGSSKAEAVRAEAFRRMKEATEQAERLNAERSKAKPSKAKPSKPSKPSKK